MSNFAAVSIEIPTTKRRDATVTKKKRDLTWAHLRLLQLHCTLHIRHSASPSQSVSRWDSGRCAMSNNNQKKAKKKINHYRAREESMEWWWWGKPDSDYFSYERTTTTETSWNEKFYVCLPSFVQLCRIAAAAGKKRIIFLEPTTVRGRTRKLV